MNTEEIWRQISRCIKDIEETEKRLSSANEALMALELRPLKPDGIGITLGGVHHQVTEYDPRLGQVRVVPGMQDIHRMCLKLQREHILKLKSRIEGMAFRAREFSKKLGEG